MQPSSNLILGHVLQLHFIQCVTNHIIVVDVGIECDCGCFIISMWSVRVLKVARWVFLSVLDQAKEWWQPIDLLKG